MTEARSRCPSGRLSAEGDGQQACAFLLAAEEAIEKASPPRAGRLRDDGLLWVVLGPLELAKLGLVEDRLVGIDRMLMGRCRISHPEGADDSRAADRWVRTLHAPDDTPRSSVPRIDP